MEAYRQADLERKLATLKAQLREAQRVTKAMDSRRQSALRRVEQSRAAKAHAWENMPCDYFDAELERQSQADEQLMLVAEENYVWALSCEASVCASICKEIQSAYEH